jgi:glycosyltransferase involved in cell wall biosynthesis
MPLVSIITPVLPRADDHLRAAYRSLADQALPAGWEWEWLVHIDGGGIPDWLDELTDPRVHVAADAHHHGAALARNLLVSRSAGSHLKVLDADDQLTPGALARDLEVVCDHPDVAWVTSRARDLLDDGTLVEFDGAPAPGLVPTGALFRAWVDHDFRSSIHPATLLAERRAVLALGGWTAVPTSEDTALLLALNCRELGYFRDDVGLIYRKWSSQLTSQDHHHSAELSRLRHAFIQQRCELLLRS